MILIPRFHRIHSNSGIYHVVARGIGKQRLFEDSGDYYYFLKKLKYYQDTEGFHTLAYCLMDNHIHLLLDAGNKVSHIVQRLLTCYAIYFNTKYDRSGHVFQNRFYSEPIEDSRYLLTAVNYIHYNPEKAGIARHDTFLWSSWHDYIRGSNTVFTSTVLTLTGGIDGFLELSASVPSEKCLDISRRVRLTDADAVRLICQEAGTDKPTDLQSFDRLRRDDMLRTLRKKHLSIRQLERLTGIPRGIISRA